MMDKILNLPITDLSTTSLARDTVTRALEQGQVVFFPHLPFVLRPAEIVLVQRASEQMGKAKNVSYHATQGTLKAYKGNMAEQQQLTRLMQRYVDFTQQMISHLTPAYQGAVRMGRTSFRPVEIAGRKTSPLKDDTKLHVDAFVATPVQGQRLLRVFANINPHNQPRRWLLGEPFAKVVERFMPQARAYQPLKARAMRALRLTKSLRTAYDHYMLHLHDSMKLDVDYQQQVDKISFDFPAASCWMVYTDVVSHAALSGQYLLEQTFYLSPASMLSPGQSPLKILEQRLGQELV